MSTPKTKTELLKSHESELVKQYIVYDAQDRPEYVYTAVVDQTHGGACLVTRYVYANATTTRVSKRKEYYATWDSTWDI